MSCSGVVVVVVESTEGRVNVDITLFLKVVYSVKNTLNRIRPLIRTRDFLPRAASSSSSLPTTEYRTSYRILSHSV